MGLKIFYSDIPTIINKRPSYFPCDIYPFSWLCLPMRLCSSGSIYIYFLLLNSVYTGLPLSQGLDRVKGGTIHMKTVKYVHTKLCLSVYTEYY